MINYNDFSKINNKQIKEQILVLKDFLNNFSNNINKEFYNKIINIKKDIDDILMDLDNNIDISGKKCYYNIKQLVLSLKETRDSYYLIEINNIKNKVINNVNLSDYNFIYITKDEISNSRCILNKISTINVIGYAPRYFAFINKNNELILKLFNVFYRYIDKISNEYKEIQKYNANLITYDSKSIIKKKIIENIITGGNMTTLFNSNKKIDLKEEIINNYDKMDSVKEIVNDYDEIKKTIQMNIENMYIHYKKLFSEPFKSAIELSKNNKEYIDSKNEINKIFNYFISLYQNIDGNELKKNIVYDNEYKSVFNSFINSIYYMINERVDLYNKYYKVNITNLDGIYIACLLNLLVWERVEKHQLKALEFIFPELFEKYPIYEYVEMLYIESTIYRDKKNTPEEDRDYENEYYND